MRMLYTSEVLKISSKKGSLELYSFVWIMIVQKTRLCEKNVSHPALFKQQDFIKCLKSFILVIF